MHRSVYSKRTLVADRHMRRYLEAYLPDSGFEYAVTHRYDAVRKRFSHGVPMRTELCLLAVSNIRPGDFVRYCSAALRDLSQAEDEAMRDEAQNARVALSLIHISEPTRPSHISRMPSSA